MEKLANLAATGQFDLIVVDTPPSRSALDFLDAPQRLSSFMDGRMIKLLATPSRGVMKIVGAGFALFSGRHRGARRAAAVRCRAVRAAVRGHVRRVPGTGAGHLRTAAAPGTKFVVVSICEGDALREASYFTDRLRAEHMPLAGLVLNRTHPALAELAAGTAQVAATTLAATAPLTAAVLGIHVQRLAVRAAELHMRARFDRVHTDLPVVEVPALPSDAHDVPALREIGPG